MGDDFFFSSRRRHTRYWRDWSSDVCSSDLAAGRAAVPRLQVPRDAAGPPGHEPAVQPEELAAAAAPARALQRRSEERRVGKEGRSRWSPYHLKKKINILPLLPTRISTSSSL